MEPKKVEYQQLRIAILLESDKISSKEAAKKHSELDLGNANKQLTESLQDMIMSKSEAGEETINFYLDKIDRDPGYYSNYYLLANEYMKLGRYEEAMKKPFHISPGAWN